MRKKSTFTKEIERLVYGFGDVENPRMDTVELLEEMVTEYIVELVKKSVKVNQHMNISSLPAAITQPRLRTEDIMFVLRDDPKKLARVEELLYMNEELKRARKAFDEPF